MVAQIGPIRKQRELDPVLDMLKEMAASKEIGKSEEEQEFKRQIKELNVFTHQVGQLADKLSLSPKGELLLKLIKMFL